MAAAFCNEEICDPSRNKTKQNKKQLQGKVLLGRSLFPSTVPEGPGGATEEKDHNSFLLLVFILVSALHAAFAATASTVQGSIFLVLPAATVIQATRLILEFPTIPHGPRSPEKLAQLRIGDKIIDT